MTGYKNLVKFIPPKNEIMGTPLLTSFLGPFTLSSKLRLDLHHLVTFNCLSRTPVRPLISETELCTPMQAGSFQSSAVLY